MLVFIQISMEEANLFHGQFSDNSTNVTDFSRRPLVTVHISGDSPVSNDSRHRTQNQVRYNLEEGENTFEHIPLSNETSANNSDNETSVDQNDLLSFISFEKELHCEQIYIGDDSCVICLEQYNENNHHTVVLPCGHILCLQCTTTLARNKRYSYVECPSDRLEHKIKDFIL